VDSTGQHICSHGNQHSSAALVSHTAKGPHRLPATLIITTAKRTPVQQAALKAT